MKRKYAYLRLLVALSLVASLRVSIYAQDKLHYKPDGNAIVSVNGTNKFNRNIYSGVAGYIVKTSDRPLFLISRGRASKQLDFSFYLDGKILHLDATEYCQARYADGIRSYILRDSSWGGNAMVEVSVVASPSREAAIVKVSPIGIDFRTQLIVTIGDKDTRQYQVNGDVYVEVEGLSFGRLPREKLARRFNISERWSKAAARRILVETPDAYLNNAMGAMLVGTGKWHGGLDSERILEDSTIWKMNHKGASKEIKHAFKSLNSFQSGRPSHGRDALRSAILEEMYLDKQPVADAMGVAGMAMLHGLFGLQPDSKGDCCKLRPAFPREWDNASIRTPYINYDYRREGGKDIYEITQNFDRPMTMVVCQHQGYGRYKEFVGTNKKYQTIVIDAIDYDVPDDTISNVTVDSLRLGLGEPSFDGKFKTVKIDKFFNKDIAETHPTKLYVPFHDSKHRHKAIVASSNGEYADGFDVKVDKGSYRYAYVLLTGNDTDVDDEEERVALLVATYADDTQTTLPVVFPHNWSPGNYADHKVLKMTLDSGKKLETISIVTLSKDVEVGMEALTLQK